MVWAAESVFRVGGGDVAVRSSSEELDLLLREFLATHLAPRVTGEARRTYSLRIIDPPGDGSRTRPIHQLFRDRCLSVRARTVVRAVEALLHHLGHDAARQRDGLVEVRSLALIGPGGALLVPDSVRRDLQRVERRLWDVGVAAVDAPASLLDVDTGELVVTRPLEPITEAMRERTESLGPAAPAESRAGPGSYAVVGWLLRGDAPRSRAQAVARIMNLVTGEVDPGAAFPVLARAVRGAQVGAVGEIGALPRTAATVLAGDAPAVAAGVAR